MNRAVHSLYVHSANIARHSTLYELNSDERSRHDGSQEEGSERAFETYIQLGANEATLMNQASASIRDNLNVTARKVSA